MSNEFKRKERYIVFKISDVVEHLTTTEALHLARLYEIQRVGRKKAGKSELECVVVEKDWPEYEPTWRAIEVRMTGAQQAPDGSAVQTAARIMNVDLIRQRDALRAEIEELHALIAAVKKQANAEFCLRVKKEEEYARLQAKINTMKKRLRLILEEPENTLSNSKALREVIRQAKLAMEESK